MENLTFKINLILEQLKESECILEKLTDAQDKFDLTKEFRKTRTRKKKDNSLKELLKEIKDGKASIEELEELLKDEDEKDKDIDEK